MPHSSTVEKSSPFRFPHCAQFTHKILAFRCQLPFSHLRMSQVPLLFAFVGTPWLFYISHYWRSVTFLSTVVTARTRSTHLELHAHSPLTQRALPFSLRHGPVLLGIRAPMPQSFHLPRTWRQINICVDLPRRPPAAVLRCHRRGRGSARRARPRPAARPSPPPPPLSPEQHAARSARRMRRGRDRHGFFSASASHRSVDAAAAATRNASGRPPARWCQCFWQRCRRRQGAAVSAARRGGARHDCSAVARRGVAAVDGAAAGSAGQSGTPPPGCCGGYCYCSVFVARRRAAALWRHSASLKALFPPLTPIPSPVLRTQRQECGVGSVLWRQKLGK